MRNCQQLSSIVYCCVVTTDDNISSIDKGTHCFRQSKYLIFVSLSIPIINYFIKRHIDFAEHFYAKNMQMTRTWQTLSNDETVVLLQNMAGKYNMFDAKHGNLMPILDNEDYLNLTPVASFFGMDNAQELTELAQDDNKFYICEYLRDSKHRFLLQECYETKLLKLENFSHVKFCANPIYHAIIQLINVNTNIKWQLQVTYTSTNGITDNNIYTVDSIDMITNEQIAMICSPYNIDIYLVSNNVIVHYAIDLPKVDGETLIVD
uniref:ODV-E66 n=1 Tax=Elaeophora elaphi TaxID=1147741 RepID=A0A0R3RLH6_9BILA